jgi:hypothetical protein
VLTLSTEEIAQGSLSNASLHAACEAMASRGHLVVPNAFPRAFVENLAQAYEAFRARVEDGYRPGTGVGVGDKRRMIPVEVEPPFDDPALYASPLLLPILRALLGEDCILNSYASVVARPGAPPQPPHKDHDFLFEEPVAAELPPWAVTMVVPLTDLDEETGTTALWDQSHRVNAVGDGAQILPYVGMGGCYLMDYRLTHGGTANRSRKARSLLYIVYSRPWFLDERNFYSLRALRVSPASYARVPESLRPLFARVT